MCKHAFDRRSGCSAAGHKTFPEILRAISEVRPRRNCTPVAAEKLAKWLRFSNCQIASYSRAEQPGPVALFVDKVKLSCSLSSVFRLSPLLFSLLAKPREAAKSRELSSTLKAP